MGRKLQNKEYFLGCKTDPYKFQITLLNPGKLEKYGVDSIIEAPEEAGVYFFVGDDFDFGGVKVGDTVELDESFKVLAVGDVTG